MTARSYPLDAVRTDGWFERIGESIGSFQALCDIVGERFFAFALVAGVRITALTVDRRSPDATIVEFHAGDEDVAQRVSLSEFRRAVVGALLTAEPSGPPPSRDTDVEALQQHLGIRSLLLAPIFGISLRRLVVTRGRSLVVVRRDGLEETLALVDLRSAMGALVRQELERVSGGARASLDFSKVADAQAAAEAGDHARVLALLGSWPAPLAIFFRTPEGKQLPPDARAVIAKGLALLGTACVRLGEAPQAEEILRLGLQWAGEGALAGDIFRRLGEAYLDGGRPGEAIAPLRRAMAFGAPQRDVAPLLGRAFLRRGRHVAALAMVRKAFAAGVTEPELATELLELERVLGPSLTRLQGLLASRRP